MNRAVIEERIHAAIRPVIERADRLLWELANPRTLPGRHTREWPLAERFIEAAPVIIGQWQVIQHHVRHR